MSMKTGQRSGANTAGASGSTVHHLAGHPQQPIGRRTKPRRSPGAGGDDGPFEIDRAVAGGGHPTRDATDAIVSQTPGRGLHSVR